MSQEEFNEIIEGLKRNIANGDVQSMKWLGDMYYQGLSGHDQNILAAFPYWKMAADHGDDEIAFKVGLCYQTGNGCEEDDAAAFPYLLRSANQGNAEAQYRVGLCYYHGIGIEENKDAGIHYIRLAARQNHAGALEALGEDQAEERSSSSSDGGGCYIATAVYGSYNAPEVMVLRGFRDNTLQQHWWGRLFVKTYYLLSPPVANWLKDAKQINAFVRRRLDSFVEKIEQSKNSAR